MILATTIADFRDYVNTPAEAVRAYEGTGFRHLDYSFYVENKPGSVFMSDNWQKPVADALNEAQKLGFDFVQSHSPGNDWFNEEDKENVIKGNIRAIEACGLLGIKKLVVHSGRSHKLFYPDDWQTYLEGVKDFYSALYPAMEKYGVYVLAENYIPAGAPLCSLYSAGQLNELLSVCSHPLLGVCWDVGHANLTNPKQYEDLVQLGENLKAVHIQDNFGVMDDHLCPLMGTLDLDAVMRGLRDNGFIEREGVFTFECDNVVTPPDNWPHCRNQSSENIANFPTFAVKKAAVKLMYEVGRATLEKYGCFDE